MQPDARVDAEVGQCVVVCQRVASGLNGGLEHHEEAVAAVDLAALMQGQQFARAAIVFGPQRRGPHVAQPLRELRAVNEVGKDQRPFGGSGLRCRRPLEARTKWFDSGFPSHVSILDPRAAAGQWSPELGDHCRT